MCCCGFSRKQELIKEKLRMKNIKTQVVFVASPRSVCWISAAVVRTPRRVIDWEKYTKRVFLYSMCSGCMGERNAFDKSRGVNESKSMCALYSTGRCGLASGLVSQTGTGDDKSCIPVSYTSI